MSRAESSRAPPGRAPLGDATRRVNNSQHQYSQPAKPYLAEAPHHETLPPDATRQQRSHLPRSPSPQGDLQAEVTPSQVPSSPKATVAYARLSAISKEYQGDNSNRNSQISTTSTNASDGRRRKTHIGPWNLGKTLGKGATARVRLARHAITQQTAAIKIVQKKNAQLSQAGSLASLDRKDAAISHPEDNLRRMPYGIEREVAIMKLIEHPHILKLYDIWENRTEM
jgi:serine/threonine-protein kinase HSL1 (negative regulator of Swe1 kinase)